MSRVTALALGALVALAMTSCGGNGDREPTPGTSVPSTTLRRLVPQTGNFKVTYDWSDGTSERGVFVWQQVDGVRRWDFSGPPEAKVLGTFLISPKQGEGDLLGLDDFYCLWTRARTEVGFVDVSCDEGQPAHAGINALLLTQDAAASYAEQVEVAGVATSCYHFDNPANARIQGELCVDETGVPMRFRGLSGAGDLVVLEATTQEPASDLVPIDEPVREELLPPSSIVVSESIIGLPSPIRTNAGAQADG